MTMLKQISALTMMGLKGIPDRPLAALVTIAGVAAMVAVMAVLLSLGAGLSAGTSKNIGPDMAVVVARGAASDYMGSISRDAVNVVAEAPGVKKDAQGRPIVTPSVGILVDVLRKGSHEHGKINLVGIPAERFAGRGGNRLTKGRAYRPGLRELVAGRVAARRYEQLQVGDRITLRGSQWTVVGEFEADGAVSEGGLFGDAETILSAFNRNAFQQIEVQLNSAADFAGFKATIVNDPRAALDVKLQRQYVEEQTSQLTAVINFVGYFVGTVMALGAFFGIVNTMYAAIDARRREFSALRAVGFSRLAILVSITLESLALSLPGALLGVIAAWLLFDGHVGQVSDLAFPITVTSGVALVGVGFTIAIGLIGGLVPAIASARQPLATALRAS